MYINVHRALQHLTQQHNCPDTVIPSKTQRCRANAAALQHLTGQECLQLQFVVVTRVYNRRLRFARRVATEHDRFPHLLKHRRRRALQRLPQPPLLLLHSTHPVLRTFAYEHVFCSTDVPETTEQHRAQPALFFLYSTHPVHEVCAYNCKFVFCGTGVPKVAKQSTHFLRSWRLCAVCLSCHTFARRWLQILITML